MSDSTSIERWRELRETLPDAKEREEISDLPPWVRIALVKRQLEGCSYDEAAKAFGKKSGGQLRKYAQSPAASKWMEELRPFLEDPVEMGKALLRASAAGVTVDRLVFLELAKAAGDYVNGDKIARDLQERMGIVAKRNDPGPLKVVVQLSGGSIDAPVIEAEWEESSEDS